MIEYLSTLIESHGIIAIFASLGVGVLTSLAPCSLVGLPIIAGFAANMNVGEDIEAKTIFIRKFTLIFVVGVIMSITILFLLLTQFKYILNSSPVVGYLLAGTLCLYVGLSAFGVLKKIRFDSFTKKLIKYKMIGAFGIGLLIGLVSSPCASPAIASILIVAQGQSFLYSLFLVLSFAVGHSVVLIFSGFSISFIEKVSKVKSISFLATSTQKLLSITLIAIGAYFFYKSYILGIIL